jgi:hypothetical protein
MLSSAVSNPVTRRATFGGVQLGAAGSSLEDDVGCEGSGILETMNIGSCFQVIQGSCVEGLSLSVELASCWLLIVISNVGDVWES